MLGLGLAACVGRLTPYHLDLPGDFGIVIPALGMGTWWAAGAAVISPLAWFFLLRVPLVASLLGVLASAVWGGVVLHLTGGQIIAATAVFALTLLLRLAWSLSSSWRGKLPIAADVAALVLGLLVLFAPGGVISPGFGLGYVEFIRAEVARSACSKHPGASTAEIAACIRQRVQQPMVHW